MAVSSPRRSMTYRKLWSRIERATARLQQEWMIGKGDIVAYRGHSHPDALVLYFALARSGAQLLPISPTLPFPELLLLARRFHACLLLEDDELTLAREMSFLAIKPLSSLIATRCPQEPANVVEDARHPALLYWRESSGAGLEAYSLAQLWEQGAGSFSSSLANVDKLLEPAVMSRVVLPALESGGCLMLP